MKRFLAGALLAVSAGQAIAEDVTQYVNPFIGTSNFGATNPGAQYPNGMTSVVPFNVAYGGELTKFEKDAAWNSRGYISENKYLTGFSHINLSGVGCPDLGTVITMPTAGDLVIDPKVNGSEYTNEVAHPGYYSNQLTKYDIKTEVSSTLRTGISRYTFKEGQANILLNLGLGLTNETGGMVKVKSATEVEGYRMNGTFCYHPEDVRPVYFVAQFSKPADEFGAWKKMPKYKAVEADWIGYNDTYKPYEGFRQEVAGDDVGAYFTYFVEDGETVEVKVGISYVSIENARENLAKEQPNFDFDKTVKASNDKWQELLSRVEVEGSNDHKTIFYTGLYHTLIHPNIFQDVNGDYPLNGQYGVGNTKGENRYTVYSLWDTNRNVHPLLSLVYPELQSDMVNSMVDMAEESGWLPKWELLGMETQVMVGDPATPVIADTYLRGIRDFDVEKAYKYAKKAAEVRENNLLRPESAQYQDLGYVAVDGEELYGGSVSTSLEYYIADWNLARLAKALGKNQDAKQYHAQSMGYKKLFDETTGMLRPKHVDGKWLSPYDPELGRNFEPAPGYIEGNAWNYRFYVPHDMRGLIDLLGGDKAFLTQLEKTFATDNFDMANEPDITYPFLFNYVKGDEWKTTNYVHELIAEHFTNKPAGLPGNDDTGTMSAWLVYSMMGFYPVSPGDMDYALFAPVFDKVTIHLNDKYYAGKSIVISKDKGGIHGKRVGSIVHNGKKLSGYFLDHHKLTRGGNLHFNLTKAK